MLLPLFPLNTVPFPDCMLDLQLFEMRYLDMLTGSTVQTLARHPLAERLGISGDIHNQPQLACLLPFVPGEKLELLVTHGVTQRLGNHPQTEAGLVGLTSTSGEY